MKCVLVEAFSIIVVYDDRVILDVNLGSMYMNSVLVEALRIVVMYHFTLYK